MLSFVVTGVVFLLSIFGTLQYFGVAYRGLFSGFMTGKNEMYFVQFDTANCKSVSSTRFITVYQIITGTQNVTVGNQRSRSLSLLSGKSKPATRKLNKVDKLKSKSSTGPKKMFSGMRSNLFMLYY